MDEAHVANEKREANQDVDDDGLTGICKNLDELSVQFDGSTEALFELGEQLRTAEIRNDKIGRAQAHASLGEIHAALGNWFEAFFHHEQHFEIAKETDNLFQQQRALASLAKILYHVGKTHSEISAERREAFSAARRHYSYGIEISNLLKRDEAEMERTLKLKVRILMDLALICQEERNCDKAIDHISTASDLAKNYGFPEDVLLTNLELAKMHERLGRLHVARMWIDRAVETNDPWLKAVASLAKAEFLLRRGHWTKARKMLVSLYVSELLKPEDAQHAEKLLRIVVTIDETRAALKNEPEVPFRFNLWLKLGNIAMAVRSYEASTKIYNKLLICARVLRSPAKMKLAYKKITLSLCGENRLVEAETFASRYSALCENPSEKSQADKFIWELFCRSTFGRVVEQPACHGKSRGVNKKLVAERMASILEANEPRNEKKMANESVECEIVSDEEPSCWVENIEPDPVEEIIGGEIVLEDLPDVAARREQDKVSSSDSGSDRSSVASLSEPPKPASEECNVNKKKRRPRIARKKNPPTPAGSILTARERDILMAFCGWTPY